MRVTECSRLGVGDKGKIRCWMLRVRGSFSLEMKLLQRGGEAGSTR